MLNSKFNTAKFDTSYLVTLAGWLLGCFNRESDSGHYVIACHKVVESLETHGFNERQIFEMLTGCNNLQSLRDFDNGRFGSLIDKYLSDEKTKNCSLKLLDNRKLNYSLFKTLSNETFAEFMDIYGKSDDNREKMFDYFYSVLFTQLEGDNSTKSGISKRVIDSSYKIVYLIFKFFGLDLDTYNAKERVEVKSILENIKEKFNKIDPKKLIVIFGYLLLFHLDSKEQFRKIFGNEKDIQSVLEILVRKFDSETEYHLEKYLVKNSKSFVIYLIVHVLNFLMTLPVQFELWFYLFFYKKVMRLR